MGKIISLKPPLTDPVVSDVVAFNIAQTTAFIRWNNSDPCAKTSDFKIEFETSRGMGGSSNFANESPYEIQGLTACKTTYSVQVSPRDSSDLAFGTSASTTFQTENIGKFDVMV